MIGFVRAEMLRFSSRRFFHVLGALMLAGLVTAAALVAVQSSPDPNAGLAEARVVVAGCEAERDFVQRREPAVGFDCPTLAQVARETDKRFLYARQMPDVTRGVAVPLFLLAFVVGASFVGAEWGTGSMATLLTWEPRRWRALAAKVAAGVVWAALLTVVVLVLLNLFFLPVGAFRGTLSGATGGWWWTQSGIWLRAAFGAAFASTAGMSIAMLVRGTAGAVGAGFLFAAFVDPLLGAWREGRYRPWLVQHNLPRLLGLPAPGRLVDELGGPRVLSVSRPLVLFSIYGAALVLAAYASFRARDVT